MYNASRYRFICRVRESVEQYLAQYELRKMIFSRSRHEGIDIPFLNMTVYLMEKMDWRR